MEPLWVVLEVSAAGIGCGRHERRRRSRRPLLEVHREVGGVIPACGQHGKGLLGRACCAKRSRNPAAVSPATSREMSRGWVLGRSRDQGEAPRQLTAAAAPAPQPDRPRLSRQEPDPGESRPGGAPSRASVRLMATRRLNESAVGARTIRPARETATIGCGGEAAAVASAAAHTATPPRLHATRLPSDAPLAVSRLCAPVPEAVSECSPRI